MQAGLDIAIDNKPVAKLYLTGYGDIAAYK
jgi:hypothetical protein